MTAPVSVVIITLDEERKIGRCLESVSWAAEKIVVDAVSQDRTAELANALGARVYQREWPGYGAQKNFGIEKATQPWILSIDADEVVAPELAKEIQARLAAEPPEAGFIMRVPVCFMGRQLGHYGRAVEDPGKVKLFRKGHGRFDDRLVHETVQVDGQVGRLQGILVNDSYPAPALPAYIEKIHRYAGLEARERVARGQAGGNRWMRAAGKLAWMLVVRRGLLDGPAAWIWIAGQAYQEWLTTGQAARRLRRLRLERELA